MPGPISHQQKMSSSRWRVNIWNDRIETNIFLTSRQSAGSSYSMTVQWPVSVTEQGS
jgi:hypothetical protein